MMGIKNICAWMFLAVAVLLTAGVTAADKLAIAEVQISGKVDPVQAEGFAAFLETNVDGGYQLVSRAGLRAMMTELGLQNVSDLVNQQDELAQLSKLHAVKYLLVPTVSRIGSRYNLSLMVVDCATGEINAQQRATLVGEDFDQLVNQLDNTLLKMGLGRPIEGPVQTAILLPTLKLKDAPGYLAEDFTAELQSYLLNDGIKLVDRQVIDKIQAESNLTRLDIAAPGQFAKIGQLAIANFLVCPVIDRFGFTKTTVKVEYSGTTSTKMVGTVSGLVKIVDTRTGEAVKVIPFKTSMRNTDIPVAQRRDYEDRDYDDALLDALMKVLAPQVAQALKGPEAPAPAPAPEPEAPVVAEVPSAPEKPVEAPAPVPDPKKNLKKVTVTVTVSDLDDEATAEVVEESTAETPEPAAVPTPGAESAPTGK